MLSEEDPSHGLDRIADFLDTIQIDKPRGLPYILPAAWRAGLLAVEEEHLTVKEARKTLEWIFDGGGK
ncbi:hypothetical protein [Virgibacillus necropolis]|uniref:Uncharacterized protein n=1 Tax=Virgibacillus necropolis TaxID=163877 RepID=A0A221MDY3_9BACI|nr:hypothetical protein [Virgibacillus necropolis]ASN05789.1 hypothetical protein CFK40_12595 [Virgibacillus necropolis]